MRLLGNAPPRPALPDLLMTLAAAEEFSSIKLRRSEKKALNDINGCKVRSGRAPCGSCFSSADRAAATF